MADEVRSLLTAALRDRYDVQRELGRGGASFVYLAHDLKHDRQVAIKVLRPEISAAMGTQRFVREVSIAARLQNPHILPLYDSGEADGLVFYVMPLVDGESLRVRLARGPMPLEDVVRTLKHVLEGLAYAHRLDVVHRDIKPDNVLLAGRNAMVTDFGVAKALDEAAGEGDITTAGMAVGTPAYMAPEQADGDPDIDHRVDIYSFGVLAYEMLAGRTPHTGTRAYEVMRAQIYDTPTPLVEVRPDVDPALESLVMRCLAKRPDDRWPSCEELLVALEDVERSIHTTIVTPAPVQSPSRRRWALPAAVLLLAVAAFLVPLGPEASPAHDPNLLVIAPFDVLYPDHAVWSEGVVDLLSAELDGAGSLRTVAPSIAVRRWSGRAELSAVERFADQLGAGLAVFGRVLSSGPDSLRISASLYDADARRVIGEVEVEGPLSRATDVSDSLAIRLLRALGQTRAIGAVRSASLGSSSLPALRSFLRGEQAFRAAEWDSAIAYYDRAVTADSNFTLAISRYGRALAWRPETRMDPRVTEFALAAGKRNRGIAPRESLLIAADSLRAALGFVSGDAFRTLQQREMATLEDGLRRYPNDPEMWHRFGDALFHEGLETGAAWDDILGAFDRAIALDSAFTPAYEHALQVSLWRYGPERWRPYAESFLALSDGPDAAPVRAVRVILDHGPRSERAAAALDALDLEQLGTAFQALSRWPDAEESAVAVARLGVERAARAEIDLDVWLWRLSGSLAYRGHLRDAVTAVGGGIVSDLRAQIALLQPSTDDPNLAQAAFTSARADLIAPWLALRGDTAALEGMVQRLSSGDGTVLAFQSRVAGAYLALAGGDSAAALRAFATLPADPCAMCYLPRLTTVQLLADAGRPRDAAALLRYELPTPPALGRPADVLWELERGRVFESLGDGEAALRAYRLVADAWANADSELRGYVDEARAAVQRLAPTGDSPTRAR